MTEETYLAFQEYLEGLDRAQLEEDRERALSLIHDAQGIEPCKDDQPCGICPSCIAAANRNLLSQHELAELITF